MTYHGPDQGSASDWSLHRGKLASTNQKNYPDLGSECRQSRIFAVVRLFIRRNFAGKQNVGITKYQLFSQASATTKGREMYVCLVLVLS